MKNNDLKHETALATQLYQNPSTKPESAETATPSSEPTRPSREQIEARRRKIMIAMWHRMADYFGPLWESSYGTIDGTTIYAWQGAMGQFTEADLAGGIKACENWTEKFPPTFGQFRSLIMAGRSKPNFTEKREAEEKITGQPASMIEHLSRYASSHVAQRELARMRGIMAGAEAETKDESMRLLGLHRRWGA